MYIIIKRFFFKSFYYAEVWADGWAEGEEGLSSCAEVRGRRVRAEGEGFEFVRGGRGRRERGEYGFSSLLKQKIKGKNLLRHLQRRNFFFKIFML